MTGSINATYYEIDTTKITSDSIIGGVSANGEYTGLGALKLLYQEQYQVCNLLGGPWLEPRPESI